MTDGQTSEPAADAGADGCGECPLKALGIGMRAMETILKDLVPEEFWQHRRAARREALLAVRSLVDAAIERVDKEPSQRGSRAAKKIPIA